MTVMMVENCSVMQQVWRDMLASIDDLTLVGIHSGAAAAIAGLRRMPPDIVLLDLHLDDGSGIDVLRVLAAEQPDAKVVVVTSENDPFYHKYCMNAGAYAFYGKNQIGAIQHALAHLASLKSSDPVITE